MRPLHRPMFRYGGPIKEGVMSGIKEPVRKAALVGNSVYPQTGGREHHNILKTIIGWGAKPALGTGASQATKKTVGTQAIQGLKNFWQRIKPTPFPPSRVQTNVGMGGVKLSPAQIQAGMGTKGIPFAQRASQWVRKNPWWTAGGVVYGGPAAGELGYKAVKGPGWSLVKQAADLAVPDWLWDQDKWEAERKEKKELENKLKTTTETNPWKDKYEALLEANKTPPKSAEEVRNERIQKYRDIMDIKGMNKRAAYDSLIAASQAVGESEDFKGDIKSGKLINDIIQATSKQFDKPAKTKDAIDTLILKGEIEKDIKSSMPTEAEKTAAAFGISNEEYKNKLLGKNTPAEYIATLSTKATGGKANSALVSQGYKSAGIIPKATIKDSIVDEWIEDKDGRTEIDYVKEVISKADGFGPGLYVVGDRAVLFDGTTYKYDY